MQSLTFRVLVVLVALVSALPAFSQKLITFDAPTAGTSSGTGTQPVAINFFGTITGIVVDKDQVWRGFVRNPDGSGTAFEAPGADHYLGCTCPMAINDEGVIIGIVSDANGVYHGFIRKPNGKITVFDVPGTDLYVFPLSISDDGTVVGYYFDFYGIEHAFLRTPSGKITEFQDPSGTILTEATRPDSINNFGVIAGIVEDTAPQGLNHGFLRSRKGQYTHFDVPGAIYRHVSDAYVNDLGAVAGTYIAQQATDHAVVAGYTRSPDGTITTFASPTGSLKNLFVYGLNLQGTVVGAFERADIDEDHAFVRYANGRMVAPLFPPEEIQSVSLGINASGTVVGWWQDSQPVTHGFILSPR